MISIIHNCSTTPRNPTEQELPMHASTHEHSARTKHTVLATQAHQRHEVRRSRVNVFNSSAVLNDIMLPLGFSALQQTLIVYNYDSCVALFSLFGAFTPISLGWEYPTEALSQRTL